jgi:O-antigen ligase
MLFKINLRQLSLILNWLFIFFPLSFIAGNLLVNLNLLLVIIFGSIFLVKKNIKINYNPLILIFFFFCIAIIISSIFNQINISKAFLYLRFLIFYFICFNLIKEKVFNLDKIFYFYAIIVAIVCFDLIFQYFLGYNIIGLEIHRFGAIQKEVPTSFFLDEKIAGSFIQNFGFYLSFIIFSKFNKNNFYSLILKSFLISLISISIFISSQRMPMVIWIFFLTIYGIIYYKSKLLPILLSFAILTLFVSSFASKEMVISYTSFYSNAKIIGSRTFKNYNIMKDEKLWEEIKADPSKAKHFERGTGHSSLFAQAFYIWNDSKILGIGYKNFYNKTIEKKLTRETTHPHNYYLDVLVSTGLVGLIILITYLMILFSKTIYSLRINIRKRNHKQFDVLIVTFINFLIIFFPLKSTGSFFTTSSSTYMMITLVILLSQLQTVNSKKKLFKYF